MVAAWRQELFSSPQQARELVPLLARHGVTHLNVPNKQRGERQALLDRCRALVAALPPTGAVCCHWSLSNNYCRSPDAAFDAFRAFCADLAAIGRCSLLLVSGSPRKKFDTVAALERAAADPQLRRLQLPLAVAFNPYFPDEERQQEERQRLRRKLQAGRGMVAAVYLQAGSDVGRLQVSLQWLQTLLDELEQQAAGSGGPAAQQQEAARPAKRQRRQPAAGQQGGRADSSKRPQQAGQPLATAASRPAADAADERSAGSSGCTPPPTSRRIQVYGSVLVPSKKLLAQMRFRPWGGVFLSEEYLGSVEAADRITERLLQAYARHGVVPLVETEVASEAAAERVRQLLRGAADGA